MRASCGACQDALHAACGGYRGALQTYLCGCYERHAEADPGMHPNTYEGRQWVDNKEERVSACPSTIHAEDGELAPEARFSGTFRPWWWESGRVERVTYCLRCAGLGVAARFFALDEPSGEVEAWIEAKQL